MKAIVKKGRGIKLCEVPVPRPKAHEVLIKIALTGLCRTDMYVAKGTIKVKEGTILGHEFSGTVVRLGAQARGFSIGDRVAVMPIVPDDEGNYVGPMMGLHSPGAYAEYVCVATHMVYKIPSTLDFRKAAYAEPVAASLAVLHAPIRKKQTGIIIGSSRIATLTLRVMQVFGFHSVTVVEPKDLRSIPDDSLDFAIETVIDAEIFAQMVRIVKPKGVIVLKSRQYHPASVVIASVVKKDLTLCGTYYGSFKTAIQLLGGKKLKVDDILGAVYSFEEGVELLQKPNWEHGHRKIFFSAQ